MGQIALVTGASGAIGQTLIKHLSERGYHVRALVRNASSLKTAPDSIEIVEGDITDSKTIRRAVEGADKIFHLAAKLHINNPSQSLFSEYKRVNVEGTRQLAEAAQSAGAGRLIFFSTINVYGPSGPGRVFDEDSPLRPDSYYAVTKIEGEQVVMNCGPAVVLRLAAVYGPEMKGNYPRLLNALKRGRLAFIGDGSNRRTLVHVEDVCHAAILAAEHSAAVGQTYNVTDGQVHTLFEIIEAMSKAASKPVPRIHLPKGPVRLMAGFIEDGLRLIGKKSPVGRATVDKFIEDIAVSGEKIQQQLGFHPHYDLRAGWQETIERMSLN